MEHNKQEFINKITIKLASFEKERKKRILNLLIKQVITFAIAFLACKGLFLETNTVVTFFCIILAFYSSIAFFFNFSFDNKEFKTFLKEKCRTQILKTFNLTSLKGETFTNEFLKKSNLFPLFLRQEFDDSIEGCYKDTQFKIVETKLISKTKQEYDVFNGVIIAFKANKKISSETLITSKWDKNIRNYPATPNFAFIYIIIGFSIICTVGPIFLIIKNSLFSTYINPTSYLLNILSLFGTQLIIPMIFIIAFLIYIYKQRKKMQNVNLEDTNFEKQFNVYTQDQIEARYLLTPTFMERLKSLNTSFGTKGIKCSFFDEYIMFAIPTKKDLFELGSLYKSLSSNKLVEKFYDELHSIQEMIDHLKLNEKIGL